MELLKVVVQPVVLERDDDGKIVREHIGEPAAIYTLDQLHQYVENLAASVATMSRPEANGAVVKA